MIPHVTLALRISGAAARDVTLAVAEMSERQRAQNLDKSLYSTLAAEREIAPIATLEGFVVDSSSEAQS